MKKTKNPFFFLIALIIIIASYVVLNKEEPKKVEETKEADEPITEEVDHFIVFSNLADAYPQIIDDQAQIRELIAFDLSYNETHEQANWVVYLLTKEELSGIEKRKDNFRIDPEIRSGSANLKDYKKSGYDRGHMAPAADMKLTKQIMSESFYMSNMSPQKPYFNRGIWRKLEEHVRKLVTEQDSILVISGPIFKDNIDTIGGNEVTVPGYYFKVLLDLSWPDNKAIAYLMRNEKNNADISEFAISIDSLESFSQYDFFYQMKGMDEIEKKRNLILTD